MKVLVVSNMYPTKAKPYFGTFVKACVEGYRTQDVSVETSVINGSGLLPYLRFYFVTFLKCVLNRYDFVHVHYVTHSVPPVYFANIIRKQKVLLNFHGSDAFPEAYEAPLRRKLKRFICNKSIRVAVASIVPSLYFKNKMELAYPNIKIVVSPSGGVNKKLFKPSIKSGATVLFAGRMIEEKGPLIAAEAVKSNSSKIARVIFIGDGPLLGEVKSILGGEGVNAEYYGMLPHDKLAALMGESDIFLFPSTREGESLGLVLVESIFCGCIPLAIDNGAVSEIIPEQWREYLIVKSSKLYSKKLAEVLVGINGEVQLLSDLNSYATSCYSFESTAEKLVKELKDV